MKIFSAEQIREIDRRTLEQDAINSWQLMERAARALSLKLRSLYSTSQPFYICVGPGNNGGDGLALARLLIRTGYPVVVWDCRPSDQSTSTDFRENLRRYRQMDAPYVRLENLEDEPPLPPEAVVVDALFGSGTNRPLAGFYRELVLTLNRLPNVKVAIDVPSGMAADMIWSNSDETILACSLCLSLASPKSNFYQREFRPFVGQIELLDIGWNPNLIAEYDSSCELFRLEDARELYRPRKRHSYKSNYGHALIIGGSANSLGAALLSGKACARSGAGLVSLAIPKTYAPAAFSYLPEAQLLYREEAWLEELNRYNALAIGPGLGVGIEEHELLKVCLKRSTSPMVLDADALNLLAEDGDLLAQLAPGFILTPHIGELKRLMQWEVLPRDYRSELSEWAAAHEVYLLVKDSFCSLFCPDGRIYFVDEGSPSLATAGSGDVLTGCIAAFLAQGYAPREAALLGCFLQAKAATMAGAKQAEESVVASDIPEYFSELFREFSFRE